MRKLEIFEVVLVSLIASGLGYFILGKIDMPRTVFNVSTRTLLLVLVGIGLLLLDRWNKKRKFSDYGVRPIKVDDIKLIIGFFSLLFVFSFLVRILFPNFDFWYAEALNLKTVDNYINFAIFAIPISILLEEIFQRLLIQSKLNFLYGKKWSVIITTLNFTAVHFSWFWTGNLVYFLVIIVTIFFYLFLISVLFAYTKNIFNTVLVHLIANLVTLAQIYFHVRQSAYEFFLWFAWGALFVVSLKFLLPRYGVFIKDLNSEKRKSVSIPDKIFIVILILLPVATLIIFKII